MWQQWLTGLIGIWIIVSPWVYKFSNLTGALWNSIIFGVIIVILAIWSGVAAGKKS